MKERGPLRRWVLIAGLVLCGLVVFLAASALNRNSFPFVSELNGKLVRSSASEEFVYEFYGFQEERSTIQKAINRDCKNLGWKRISDLGSSEHTGAGAELVGLAHDPGEIADGFRNIVGMKRRIPWIEKQFNKVKGWFGGSAR